MEAVYSNTALVTKLADTPDGLPDFLSSSSMPGLMTRMLEALDVRDGHRVLEIGTGTGYNATLLSHRLGRNVFSIDIEADLVDLARARLAALGYYPTLVSGDGAAGIADHAPYDRVIVTCSVPFIPWPWIEQTRIGGVVLADLRVALNAGNLVRLTRTEPGRAEGRFDAGQASFMPLRRCAGSSTRIPYARRNEDAPAAVSSTGLDPRTPWTNRVVWFLAALRLGQKCRMGYIGDDPQHNPEAVSLSTPDGSHCEITVASDSDGRHTVRETGPVRIWAQLEHAHQTWETAGKPEWPQLGLVVTDQAQTIFIAEPSNAVTTLKLPRDRPGVSQQDAM